MSKNALTIKKLLTDGITNKLLACNLNGNLEEETILVRIYGNKTDLLIDRKAETRNILMLNELGLAPSLYATFENGLTYEFVPGTTLNVKTVADPKIYKLVATHMAKLHKVKVANVSNPKPILWTKMQRFLDLVPEIFSDPDKQSRCHRLCIPKKDLIQKEVNELREKLSKCKSPVVFAHNDLLLGNVVFTESEDKITFIDYEYANHNYQAYDIGNHFAEFIGVDKVDFNLYPNKELQRYWLRHYLNEYLGEENVTNAIIDKLYVEVNQFALASNLFWGIWCLIQVEYSNIDFDFVKYASEKLGEYFNRKEEFLSLDIHRR
ncbi:choline/ethanoalamine kinase [Holotrichia oblita]|uniref:Choline/ethanoalamine kinase n=1 Tax=Holotrichia oblita TaxID=644536 RepID=A0ACB9SWS2_HOLOL|nr:choline/ethanoalamine kinase [Holotrichia oblita]